MLRKAIVVPLPVTKARVHLGALLRRVHNNKEHFILEKNGIPVAILVDMDWYEDYQDTKDPALKRSIKEGHEEYRRGKLTEDFDTFLARLRSKGRAG